MEKAEKQVVISSKKKNREIERCCLADSVENVHIYHLKLCILSLLLLK